MRGPTRPDPTRPNPTRPNPTQPEPTRPDPITLLRSLYLWNGLTDSRAVFFVRCHHSINFVFDRYRYPPVPATARGTCRREGVEDTLSFGYILYQKRLFVYELGPFSKIVDENRGAASDNERRLPGLSAATSRTTPNSGWPSPSEKCSLSVLGGPAR